MTEPCIFCDIVAGRAPASVVLEDAQTLAFVDLRQFHPGHMLVIPKAHLADVRELDDRAGAALMASIVRITRAVATAFPNDGLSLWHSIGPAAFQEVPHLHFHVHPRLPDDRFMRIYPGALPTSTLDERERLAGMLRGQLQDGRKS
jgi:histidine triad (HIT) family protein